MGKPDPRVYGFQIFVLVPVIYAWCLKESRGVPYKKQAVNASESFWHQGITSCAPIPIFSSLLRQMNQYLQAKSGIFARIYSGLRLESI